MADRTTHVLIVEDAREVDRCFTTFLRAALVEDGYRVQCVAGTGARAVAQAQRPAVILLDLVTPQLEGATVGADVRGDPTTAHIPLIALVAYPAAPQPWADAWLDKFHLRRLYALLATGIDPGVGEQRRRQ